MPATRYALMALVLLPLPAVAAKSPPLIYGVTAEQLEYRLGDDTDVAAWDVGAEVGTDEWKLALDSVGEYATEPDAFETLEHQLTVRRLWTRFFDLKAGIRHDSPEGPDRTYAVLGTHGLAPQWFEVDADLFVNEDGDVSARLDLDYELLVTNRLILHPAFELDAAFADDEAIGIESGFTGMEVGLRLSYDVIDRTFSPYVGVLYERALGDTADRVRDEGEEAGEWFAVAGFRSMF